MIDQSHVNLMTLIPGVFKKAGNTGGGEYHGPCPFCGGKDRFRINPNKDGGGRWGCRQCGKNGDAIGFLMQYDGLDFAAACDRLNLQLPESRLKREPPKPQPPVWASDLREDYAAFEPAWQAAAEAFCYDCAGALWDHWHGRAGQYLEGRGIDRNTAVSAFLGVNEHETRATWGSKDIWLPRGIVIPWSIEQQFWNVRVRRPNADLREGDDKYISPAGSIGLAMYRASHIIPGQTVIMTEGEFDALVLQRALNERRFDHVTAVSIGSNTGARLVRWVTRLALAKRVVLAFDNDAAGSTAADWWMMALRGKVLRYQPTKKDITDMFLAGELPYLLSEVA